MRDVLDRIEHKLDQHGERLAVLESQRDPKARTRSTDKP